MSREKIAQTAEDYEQLHGQVAYDQLKCNQFVLAVLREAIDPEFPDMMANDFPRSAKFTPTSNPQRGDLVHWSGSPHGHIGIITNVEQKRFIGSQSSTGVDSASYGERYWGKTRPPDVFLRYLD